MPGKAFMGKEAAPSGLHDGARADVDALLQRHREELHQCLERWLGCWGSPGCRASPFSEAMMLLDATGGPGSLPVPEGPVQGLEAELAVAEVRRCKTAVWEGGSRAPGGRPAAPPPLASAVRQAARPEPGPGRGAVPKESLARARGFKVASLSSVDTRGESLPVACLTSPQSSTMTHPASARNTAEQLPGQVEGSPNKQEWVRAASKSCLSLVNKGHGQVRAWTSSCSSLASSPQGSKESKALPTSIPTRFSNAFGRPEKTPQHKRWEHLTSGRRWSNPARSLTPLAKRKAAMLLANQSVLERCTGSATYEVVEAVVITLNAIFVVLETEWRARGVSSGVLDPGTARGEALLNVVADLFCVFFIVSLVLHAVAERLQFFLSRERFWNIFDIVVVLTTALESVARWHQFATGSVTDFRAFASKFSALRIVRLLRIVRGTRSIRASLFVREFCIMVYSLTGAIKPLAWSVVLMCVVLLVFGVFLADGAITLYLQHGMDALESHAASDLMRYFDTLSRAVLSLYMAMSGGIDWIEVWQALQVMPSEYGAAFLAFIAFSILALLNVITAVFVETVMQRSQKDRELLVQQELERKKDFSESMQRVFEELDANGSGTLTLEEFERQLEDENVLTFLSTLELDITQVRTLLTLLDRDQNGEVDIEEFITGCLRLKGGAKSLDMAILQFQVEWILHNMATWSDAVKDKLDLS